MLPWQPWFCRVLTSPKRCGVSSANSTGGMKLFRSSSGRLSWGFAAPPPTCARCVARPHPKMHALLPSAWFLTTSTVSSAPCVVGLLHPTAGHGVHRVSASTALTKSRSSVRHNRVSPRCTTPLEEHPAVTAVPRRRGPATPSRLCANETSAETALSESPSSSGLCSVTSGGPCRFGCPLRARPDPSWAYFPFEVHCSLAPRETAEAASRHDVATVCPGVATRAQQPSEEACRLSPAANPRVLNGSSPCWMLGHPLSGWSDTEAPFLRTGLSE